MSFYTESFNARGAIAADGVEKQRLSDTLLTALPKNTSGYTYVNQLIDIQIPKTEHIINLAKSYINVKLQIPFKLDAAYTKVAEHRYFVGLMNSATMFDQVQVHSHNKVILSDELCQVNSRIWQMACSPKWLKSNGFSFINIEDISQNVGFIVHELTAATFNDTAYKKLIFNMRIPLPCLFNCFDNCDAFPTTMLNDNVTLTMQLSTGEKYLCLFETDDNGKMINISPFTASKTATFNDTHTVTFSDEESADYKIEEGFKIIYPGHYPTEEEKVDFNNIIANGGWFREFTTTWVEAQDAQFGASSLGFNTQQTINFSSNAANIYGIIMLAAHERSNTVYDKPYIKDIEMNASEIWKLANNHTHVEATYDGDNDMYQDLINVFGQQTFKNLNRFDDAIMKDYRYKGVEAYRKTVITFKLQLNNANNEVTGKVANSFNVVESFIESDVERSYINNVTQDDAAHTRTIEIINITKLDSDNVYTNTEYIVVVPDNSIDKNNYNSSINVTHGATSTKTTDITWTDATPDANHSRVTFTISSLNINAKLQNNKTYGSYMQYYRFAPSNQVGYSADYFNNIINYKFKSNYIADGNLILTRNNYDGATLFCCCQTLSFLVFKDGGIDIINPFSEELDVRAKFSNQYHSYCGNGHGLPAVIPGLIQPVTDIIGKGIGGLRRLIKENRHHANLTHAYTQLGKEGYEKHREMLEGRSTMPKWKFKKFINGIMQMEKQINSHGIQNAGNNPYGEEMAEPATFDELNLQPFTQSYSADLADCEYKNQLILDYKYGLNKYRLRLNSFGSEAAMAGNRYHGRVGDWFRKMGGKIKGWFKKDGKRIIKGLGKDLLGVAKEYAAKIATGEMSISDIKNLKPELKEKIMSIVRSNTSGTAVEGITGDAINWYRKWKNGSLKWSDIPSDMIARVKELDLKEKSGQDHGLIIKHGFVAGAAIKPSMLYSVQKQRIRRLMGKNPMEMRRKDLRRLYRFKYFKENPPNDVTHRFAELWKQRHPAETESDHGLIIKHGKDYHAKWQKRKQELIKSEHGIIKLDRMRRKAHKRKLIGDTKWNYYIKAAKKWIDRRRAEENAQQAAPAEAPAVEHGIDDYKKMKDIWKKYKQQYKPKAKPGMWAKV